MLAWLWIGKMLRAARRGGPRADPRASSPAPRLLWAMPLALAPPMFSRDVYSYLAQSATLARGIDPYVLGPGRGARRRRPADPQHPDDLARHARARTARCSSSSAAAITALSRQRRRARACSRTGCWRWSALAMIVWALPRLAERCGLDAGLVLWLGAANPLVLFHLVSGIHNESLMIGLMLAGMEIGLRATAASAARSAPAGRRGR